MTSSRLDGVNKSREALAGQRIDEALVEGEESGAKAEATEASPKKKSKGLKGLMKKISGKKEPEKSAAVAAASSSVAAAMDLEGAVAEPKPESSKLKK